MINKTFIRFLFVGLFNTIFGLSVIFFFFFFLKFDDVSSNLIGYILGFFVSFYMHGRWTYKFNGALKSVILKYTLVVFIGYLANLWAVLYLIEELMVNSYFAQSLGIFPYVFIVYLGGRFFAFKN